MTRWAGTIAGLAGDVSAGTVAGLAGDMLVCTVAGLAADIWAGTVAGQAGDIWASTMAGQAGDIWAGTVAGLAADMHDISKPRKHTPGASCYSDAQNSGLVFQIWKIFPDLFQMEAGNVLL